MQAHYVQLRDQAAKHREIMLDGIKKNSDF